jgi:polyphosphate kinase
VEASAPLRPTTVAHRLPRAVAPQAVPEDAPLDHPSLYFNRELGWLDFNWRVLFQARDERIPLLERVRFVAIASSNLDEFFQKRVGGLKRQEAAGVAALSQDGRPPSLQLELIRDAGRAMHSSLTSIWEGELVPRLREERIRVVRYHQLDEGHRQALARHFTDHVYPILTPLAVDPGHPFPFISNLSLSLAVLLRHPERGSVHFARVKVPTEHGRWLPLPDREGGHLRIPMEEVIRHRVGELFRGMEILSADVFRVTRNADVRRDDEEVEDLLSLISEELRERRFAPVVRLEVESSISRQARELLMRELELGQEDVYEVEGLLGLGDCADLAELDRPGLRFEPWEPVVPEPLQHEGESQEERNIFTVVRRGDILVHHPYDSFSASVQRLVEEAADDPDVVAIKQTLYRTSENSPVVRALMRAAEHGKQVAVLVELTARFDEARNIEWAQALEDAGVHVTYGLVGLKTHAKVTLIVRYEEGRPRTYCHFGTGNYHARTARLYTDLGLITCDRDLGYDLVNLFHFLTGHAPDQEYRQLVVAPRDMRRHFVELIRREVEHQRFGGTGRIIAKLNALDDVEIIQELYRASRAGVRIELIIRGHCRLRPGLAGISENIRVVSIIGRFLEHDRIFLFDNGGDPRVLVGSADWRERNLDRRVEAVVPVQQPDLRRRIARILELALRDNRLAWDLAPDGTYSQRCPAPGEEEINFHEILMRDALRRVEDAARTWELREG